MTLGQIIASIITLICSICGLAAYAINKIEKVQAVTIDHLKLRINELEHKRKELEQRTSEALLKRLGDVCASTDKLQKQNNAEIEKLQERADYSVAEAETAKIRTMELEQENKELKVDGLAAALGAEELRGLIGLYSSRFAPRFPLKIPDLPPPEQFCQTQYSASVSSESSQDPLDEIKQRVEEIVHRIQVFKDEEKEAIEHMIAEDMALESTRKELEEEMLSAQGEEEE